jgi:MoaA/NifB/PqqE/SkfB family radical SAM enzyme
MIDTTALKTLDPTVRDMLRERSSILGRPLIGPMSINIHIIQACDRKCKFCWYFSPLVKNPPQRKLLDYKVLERTLEDCQEIGVDEINLEGGEVVLYPHCEETFRKVKDLGMRLIAYSHLDFESKHLQYLSLADQLTVNLSSITEELYKRVHGKSSGTLHNLLSHLDLLLNLRRKYGKPKIVLTFIAYKENYKQLRAFLDLAQEREVDKVIVRFFKATQEMRELMFTKDELTELRATVEEALTIPYTFKNNLQSLWHIVNNSGMFEEVVSIDHAPMHNDRLFFYDATGGKKTPCNIGWFYSHIDEHGQVLAPCDSVGVLIAGNIYERSFKDIWFDNDVMHETLREASAGIHTCSSKWKECRHCSYVPVNKFLHDKIERTRVVAAVGEKRDP